MKFEISRRDLLRRTGAGFGALALALALGLAGVLADAGSHPRKRVAEHGLAGGQ